MKRTETARLLGKATQPIDERKACSAVMEFGFYSKSTIKDVTYKYYSSEIIITYHHEGLSGMPNLTYETISLKKYNYKSYLTVNTENQSLRTIIYDENDKYHKNPISKYLYCQTYTFTSSTKCYKEFNNIVLTFDNGISIELDALSKATCICPGNSVEKPIPKLSKIIGCIDFYPPAIYEY